MLRKDWVMGYKEGRDRWLELGRRGKPGGSGRSLGDPHPT